MINRIVKLTIDSTKTEEFIELFKSNKHHILNSGCIKVELLQDEKFENIFFTYSFWNTQEDLNAYRKSAIFAEIWKETKRKFCANPEAWSTKSIA